MTSKKTFLNKIIKEHFPTVPSWVDEKGFRKALRKEMKGLLDSSIEDGNTTINFGYVLCNMLSSQKIDLGSSTRVDEASEGEYDISEFLEAKPVSPIEEKPVNPKKTKKAGLGGVKRSFLQEAKGQIYFLEPTEDEEELYEKAKERALQDPNDPYQAYAYITVKDGTFSVSGSRVHLQARRFLDLGAKEQNGEFVFPHSQSKMKKVQDLIDYLYEYKPDFDYNPNLSNLKSFGLTKKEISALKSIKKNLRVE